MPESECVGHSRLFFQMYFESLSRSGNQRPTWNSVEFILKGASSHLHTEPVQVKVSYSKASLKAVWCCPGWLLNLIDILPQSPRCWGNGRVLPNPVPDSFLLLFSLNFLNDKLLIVFIWFLYIPVTWQFLFMLNVRFSVVVGNNCCYHVVSLYLTLLTSLSRYC